MTREEFEYTIKSCGFLIYHGQTYYEESELIKAFEDMGLIEQEPKTGHWKPFDLTYGRSIYYCTACEHSAEIPTSMGEPLYDYCPNCGCRMKGEIE